MALSSIRLLAYGLSFVSGLRELIIQAMEQSNDTRVNLTMQEQFASFIVTPLQEFASTCPSMTVVLVIDGVDECPADIRPSFLSAISAGVPLLPSTVKIYLTSRPRVDVRQCLEPLEPLRIPVAVGVGLDDGDIEYYLRHELERICKAAGLEKAWPASQIKRDASALASKAGGVFQWAWLLSSLLVNRVKPRDVVAQILNVDSSSTPEVNLDVLYTEALNIALPEVASDINLGPLYHQVVGTVLAAKQPLTVSAICSLLKADSDDASSAIQALLVNLGSVLILHRVRGGAVIVRVGHPSFRDYVTSQERCPPSWFIEPHQASVQLGSRCFSLMATTLRRDICRMGSLSVTNKDLSTGTIYQYIVTGLQYACIHAFTHIERNSGNLRMLETFLMEKLLEWLEAMTLMGLLDTAVELVQLALAVLNQVCHTLTSFSVTHTVPLFVHQQSPTSAYSIAILEDALRFVGRFGSILNKSVIHLYFSALPFTPQGTTLYRVYSARYKDIPRVTLGYPESWPEELCTVRNLNGNKRTPRHLAFSADSSRLCISTPTHLVTASPLTGVQLGKYKYRLGVGDTRGIDAEMPLAQGCRGVFSNSITSGLLLRIADSRSLKEVQLSLPPIPASQGQLPSIHTQAVTCAAFDREVNTLCVGCSDGRIQLWRLQRYLWEPERCGFPYSHSSAVICIASASELLASISQRELKIGPCHDASKPGDVTKETLTLSPRWLAGARDIGLEFAASSVASWACAVSFQDNTADDHSIHVFTSGDQNGKKIFSSTNSSSYPVYALSSDASVLTIICDGVLLRLSTVTYGLLGKNTLSEIDSTRLDRFPVVSPDGRLLAVCEGDVVHTKDLMQLPLGRPDKIPNIKAAGVIMTDKCYIVKGGKEQWLALVHDNGTFEDIAQLRENEIKHVAMSVDGTRFAALSLYQGKTQHGILEVANVNSRRRSTITWPLALHDSFTDWEICSMVFTATGRYIVIVFFLADSSYICACDLENGSLRWKQLPGKMRPLAARSLKGNMLVVVRTSDVWKIDIGNPDDIFKHDLYNSDPSKMATFYAKFTETESSSLLEFASRLWNKPPRYTIWNTDTIAQVIPEEARIKRTIAHLEVHNKNSFGYWVLSNVGQRVCCIPEEYSSKWGVRTHSSIGHDRLALLTGDGTVLIVNFQPMMEYLNRKSA